MMLKETRYADKEILNINKPVLAQWFPSNASVMMIIPLNDDEKWILDEYISLHFDGPPDYDLYGRGGIKSCFVEIFMEQINEKRFNGIFLNNFIQKDLIITLEFSDGSKIVFDRYYKEIEENLDKFYEMFK